MKRRPKLFAIALLLAALGAGEATSYSNDFSKVPDGKPPEEIAILNGEFQVKGSDGRRCLELAGEPLDTFGAQFGPGTLATGDVSASVWAERTRMRFPEFGIGADDAGGMKLWVLPGQQAIEIRRGDETRARGHYEWKSGAWLRLRLRVTKEASGWKIEGKAWEEGTNEPAAWTISATDSEELPAGRPSIWGVPFSGKPIRFTNLSFTPAG